MTRMATPSRRVRRSVQRESIVSTALELAEREGAGALTMRRLGEELAIDPTALYRLFGDKDELLLAVYDKIQAMSVDLLGPVEPDEAWPDVLRRVADQNWEITGRFPAVIALMAARTTGGGAERKLVELVLSTFARAGLPPDETVLFYRAFVDMVLALSAQTASLAMLEPEVRAKDATAWSRIYAQLPEEQYPSARAHIAELTSVTERQIYDAAVEAVIHAARARADDLRQTSRD
jgi:AcrR family transcriptional regulator